MIVGLFMPSSPHPVVYLRCWNRRRINVHIGWVSNSRLNMGLPVFGNKKSRTIRSGCSDPLKAYERFRQFARKEEMKTRIHSFQKILSCIIIRPI